MTNKIKNKYEYLLNNFKNLLKSKNLKYTKQREIMLETLYNNKKGHYTTEDIYNMVKDAYPEIKIGIATVYRTLTLFEQSDIVSVMPLSGEKKFEIKLKSMHDHMICKKCGKIIEFKIDKIEEDKISVEEKYGFKITDRVIQIYGVCKKCKQKIK